MIIATQAQTHRRMHIAPAHAWIPTSECPFTFTCLLMLSLPYFPSRQSARCLRNAARVSRCPLASTSTWISEVPPGTMHLSRAPTSLSPLVSSFWLSCLPSCTRLSCCRNKDVAEGDVGGFVVFHPLEDTRHHGMLLLQGMSALDSAWLDSELSEARRPGVGGITAVTQGCG